MRLAKSLLVALAALCVSADPMDPPAKAAPNVTVTEAPFGEPTIVGHIDTSAGAISLELGHLDESDFAIEMAYDDAQQIFVDRDPQALMGIIVGGQVKLTGDSSKILGLAGMAAPPDPNNESSALAREVIASSERACSTCTPHSAPGYQESKEFVPVLALFCGWPLELGLCCASSGNK